MAQLIPTKQDLFDTYTASGPLDSNEDCNELTEALGGAHNILTMILRSQDIQLNDHQLIKIHNIIKTKTKILPANVTQNDMKQIHEDECPQEWTYCFDKDNTYLHTIFGQDYGQKIFDIVYCKKSVTTLIICLVFSWISYPIFHYLNMHILRYIIGDIIYCISIPLTIFILLSANRKCFRLTLESFDFWLKLFYFLQFEVAQIVYYYTIIDSSEWEDYQIEPGSVEYKLDVSLYSLRSIQILLLAIGFISLDALQWKLWTKISAGIGIGILFTIDAIQYTFFSDLYGNDNSVIHIQSLDVSISVISVMASAMQILSIFIWKQVILSIIKKNRCILIKYSPYIRWRGMITTEMLEKQHELTPMVKTESEIEEEEILSNHELGAENVLSDNETMQIQDDTMDPCSDDDDEESP